jgi:hypothetical protein|tara:strand:- start:4 stop:486 length:483 start_codon:yes stop_codon:yes gene_type:complete
VVGLCERALGSASGSGEASAAIDEALKKEPRKLALGVLTRYASWLPVELVLTHSLLSHIPAVLAHEPKLRSEVLKLLAELSRLPTAPPSQLATLHALFGGAYRWLASEIMPALTGGKRPRAWTESQLVDGALWLGSLWSIRLHTPLLPICRTPFLPYVRN